MRSHPGEVPAKALDEGASTGASRNNIDQFGIAAMFGSKAARWDAPNLQTDSCRGPDYKKNKCRGGQTVKVSMGRVAACAASRTLFLPYQRHGPLKPRRVEPGSHAGGRMCSRDARRSWGPVPATSHRGAKEWQPTGLLGKFAYEGGRFGYSKKQPP